ncbi:MAG: hypothetical protein ACOC7V_03675 [Spirochaetota bacterium]
MQPIQNPWKTEQARAVVLLENTICGNPGHRAVSGRTGWVTPN